MAKGMDSSMVGATKRDNTERITITKMAIPKMRVVNTRTIPRRILENTTIFDKLKSLTLDSSDLIWRRTFRHGPSFDAVCSNFEKIVLLTAWHCDIIGL